MDDRKDGTDHVLIAKNLLILGIIVQVFCLFTTDSSGSIDPGCKQGNLIQAFLLFSQKKTAFVASSL